MIKKNYSFIIGILIISTLTCKFNEGKDKLFLPLKDNYVWYYEAKGFRSLPSNLKYKILNNSIFNSISTSFDILADSLQMLKESITKDVPFDTIKIYLKKIKQVRPDSIYYQFNSELVRFWGKEIIHAKDGYMLPNKYGLGRYYILKFPLTLNKTWKNRLRFISETWTVTAIDTTIIISGLMFTNCVEITIHRSVEGLKSLAKIYFNKKNGLIYYKDFSNLDELRLIRMTRK